MILLEGCQSLLRLLGRFLRSLKLLFENRLSSLDLATHLLLDLLQPLVQLLCFLLCRCVLSIELLLLHSCVGGSGKPFTNAIVALRWWVSRRRRSIFLATTPEVKCLDTNDVF